MIYINNKENKTYHASFCNAYVYLCDFLFHIIHNHLLSPTKKKRFYPLMGFSPYAIPK